MFLAMILSRLWSWGESNSRPSGGHRDRYDHSRESQLAAAATPGRVDPRGSRRRIFLRCQRSLPAVSGSLPAVHRCFWCQAAAVRPRVPLLVAMILAARSDQAARTRSSFSASLGVPCLRSLSNSGRTPRLPSPDVETGQPRDAVEVFKLRPPGGGLTTLPAPSDTQHRARQQQSTE